MTTRSVTYATFSLERTYDSSPARVFSAFADPRKKAQWFSGPEEWGPARQTMDFRVGGVETNVGGPPGGFVSAYEGRFMDIIPDERIVTAYTMHVDGVKLSVSLSTAEF